MKRRKHYFKSLKSKVALTLVLLLLLITVPLKNAIRFSMLWSGAPLHTVLTCNPKYNAGNSKAMQENIYVIPLKDAYEPVVGSNGSKVNNFRVHTILFIFHFSMPTYAYI